MKFEDIFRMGRDGKHISLDGSICDNCVVQTKGDEWNLFATQLSVAVRGNKSERYRSSRLTLWMSS